MDFALVYIEEAHASDEWPIGNLPEGLVINQHKTLSDRLVAVSALKKDFEMHSSIKILVDTIDNKFNESYASWPTRCWIIKDGVIAFKSMPGDGNGDAITVSDLSSWLEEDQKGVGVGRQDSC